MLSLTVVLLPERRRVVQVSMFRVAGGRARRRGVPTMSRRWPRARTTDRGAAVVEFALLLPVLLLILFGLIDFGRALNAQITLTQAAREGARLAAEGQPWATVVVPRTQAAATALSGVAVTGSTCSVGAGPGTDGVVNASYQFTFITPIGAIAALFGGQGLGQPLSLSAQGEMPCET